MNKVILMGRLVRDPETRYTQSAEPKAVVRFTIAVNKRFKREGEADADFINCVAFGKTGEFVSKYFKKGNMISVVGRINTSSWVDDNGEKKYSTDVVIDEAYFCGSKNSDGAGATQDSAPQTATEPSQFYKVEPSVDDDDLPF